MFVILQNQENSNGIIEFFKYIKGHHLLATAMALVLSYKIVNISELLGQTISDQDLTKMKKIKLEILEFVIAVVLIFLLFKIIGVNDK